MSSCAELATRLGELEGKGYRSYRDIKGSWTFPEFTLFIDHVQGDPYAAPSRVRVRLDHAVAAVPGPLREGHRAIAARDALARSFARAAAAASRSLGTGNSGRIANDQPAQTILDRTAVMFDADGVEARFTVGLPARGRRILAAAARSMLCETIPAIVDRSLRFEALDGEATARHVDTYESSHALRDALRDHRLVAFVADGALLPRRSGVDDRPLDEAVPFEAPESLAVHLPLASGERVRGLGVPEGVTLVVGGGYHGKSTLLDALASGVWDHVAGDGRERVVTDRDAVTVRTEDGRRVEGVDISGFIGALPGGRPTDRFHSDDASGSTSQAAAIAEALESGARVLLLDEDTSATNFLVRDRRMQALVPRAAEPITPFVDRVRELWERHGVSTLLVMGGSGDYLEFADTVVAMESFLPRDVTTRAEEVARAHPTGRRREALAPLRRPAPRRVVPSSIDPSHGRRAVRTTSRGMDEITFGRERIDLRAVEQIVDPSQLRTLAAALVWLRDVGLPASDGRLVDALRRFEASIGADGLDAIAEDLRGDLATVRRHELAATLNRLRSLRTT